MKGAWIIPAGQDDGENLLKIYQASIRALRSSNYTAEQIHQWIDHPSAAFEHDIQNNLVYVCVSQGEQIGFGALNRELEQVLAIYVRPEYSRKRVGSMLVDALRSQARREDIPRLTVTSTLNAVEFFRANNFTEIGPEEIDLADGTRLAGIKMELHIYQPLRFSDEQSLTDRLLMILKCDDQTSRNKALKRLKEQAPAAVLDSLVASLEDPRETIRRRAGKALTHFSTLREEPVNVGQKTDELAGYLLRGKDPRVRFYCAVLLLPVRSPAVDRAFLEALQDPEEDIAELATIEVGYRCGLEGTAALQELLRHDSWDVRLRACIALIKREAADQQVVATLEAMSHDPKAAEHDAFDEQLRELNREVEFINEAAEAELRSWGKIALIIDKAREAAQRHGSREKANPR